MPRESPNDCSGFGYPRRQDEQGAAHQERPLSVARLAALASEVDASLRGLCPFVHIDDWIDLEHIEGSEFQRFGEQLCRVVGFNDGKAAFPVDSADELMEGRTRGWLPL